jgi:DNA primase
VAALPRGEDPDTFVARNGAEALELLLKKSVESVEYFCAFAWDKSGDSLLERARLLEEEAAPLLRKVRNETARRRYALRLALSLDLPLDNVERVLRGGPAPRAAAEPSAGSNGAAPGGAAAIDPVDLELLALVSDHPRLLQRLAVVLGAVENPALREAIEKLAGNGQSARLDLTMLGDLLDPSLRATVLAAAMSGKYAEVADGERALHAIAARRDAQRNERERRDLHKKLAAARAAGDPSLLRSIEDRIIELDRARFGFAKQ